MKKNLIYTVFMAGLLLFCPQISKAQITLEHTFDGSTNYSNTSYQNIGIDRYIQVNEDNNQIKIFNTDYSLYKTITITPPTGYELSSIFFLSMTLFNSNSKIEFLVRFILVSPTTETFSKYSSLKLYDEDGTMLKDFGTAYYIYPYGVFNIDNKFKLLISRQTYNGPTTTEVYSLPGNVTNAISGLEQNYSIQQSPYPNPAHSIINLPYKLNQGENSIMRILNLQGQLIEQKKIDFTFDRILLDVSNYPKGIYFYEVKGKSSKFVVQ
ncbi:MAG: T9SS type A sorting domain-containing protein [Bacteroidales bacterium]|jgi:hypothetical protein|nr:T9SS type A sorting domain-containing protein [Bacteroidales bacterium]